MGIEDMELARGEISFQKPNKRENNKALAQKNEVKEERAIIMKFMIVRDCH